MNDKMLKAFQHKGFKLPPGARPPISLQKLDINFWLAEVVDVDVERQTMSVQTKFKDTPIAGVPITQPFAGTSSFISGVPEKGSMVLLGVNFEFDIVYPVAYLPAYIYAIDHQHVQKWPDILQSVDNDLFYRHRLLKPGEINIGSGEGSEILLSYDTLLENSYGDSFLMRSSDHSIISSSLANSMFTSGVWMNAGIIQRNSLDQPNTDDGHFAYRRVLRDGRVTYQLRPENSNEFSKYYSEYLIEVEDQGSPTLPLNDINYEINSDIRRPIAILSMGNFAGNNSTKPTTYGKLLRVNLFNSPNASDGTFSFVPLIKDQPENYGMAIMLYAPRRENYEGKGALFGIDKEGHFYQYIPRASGGGLGKGRSMSIFAEGNKKEIWGAEDTSGNSWDMTLKGGLRWDVGTHNDGDINNPSLNSTSMYVKTSGRVYFQYGLKPETTIYDIDQSDKVPKDISKYKKIEKVGGYERKEVSGSRETIITGGDSYSIGGLKKEKITGFYDTHVGTSRNISIGDCHTLSVTNEAQEKIGSKKITCSKGSHELTINTIGSIKESIVVQGDRTTDITLGNIKENITTLGSRTFETKAGDYSVNVLTKGNLTHKTNIGDVVSNTKVGKADIGSSLGVSIKTQAGVTLDGLKIQLKTPASALGGNIITKNTSNCYITGAPNIGIPTITA
jgi:hypothetical protein